VQQPAGSPPLPLWIGVAALSYVPCFIIAMRLLGVGSRSAPAAVAFGLLVALLLGNIRWNAAFFRARALRLCWWVALSYWVAAMALAVTLWRVDRVALAVFVPYFIICSTAPGGSTRFVG
jgi:tryptophan-rich sensory protein